MDESGLTRLPDVCSFCVCVSTLFFFLLFRYGFGEAGLAKKGVPGGAQLRASLTLVSWKSVKMLEGTIEMKVVVEQEGYQKPNEGAAVKIKFVGKLADGRIFAQNDCLEYVRDTSLVITISLSPSVHDRINPWKRQILGENTRNRSNE